MSWFDDLFSNKENSDEELLRRKSKRRNGDLTQNKDDSLLPENNDIYDRPRGKFRFPIDVGQDENYEEAIYRDSNDDIGSYRPHSSNDHSSYDSFDYEGHTNQSNNYAKYDSSEDSRRRRRRNHINQDDTGIPSIKSRALSHQINILIHVSHNALINIKTITLVPMFQIIQKLIQITNLELSYNQRDLNQTII